MRILDVGGAVVDGVASIPIGLYYGARRTVEDSGVLGRDIQRENFAEDRRVWALMKAAFENRGILMSVITIVVSESLERLPASAIEKLADHLALRGMKIVASRATKKFIVKTVTDIVVAKIGAKTVARVISKQAANRVMSVALMPISIQGTIEQASNASKRLRKIDPRLWQKLADGNLDMLYGLVEDELAPFVALAAIIAGSDPQSRAAFTRFESYLE
ncbi:hypothetical protein [Jiella sonneratiae]|uniref:Uncharacterized protein n=1 Tax=Jiella sonneratiae TaxID=2816856 RepID=A0ABS3J394_9HYPH|nr:hypothetical protein [Jiella sonneratiae]MBO0903577.1 hypothetical protein [Jiella sonneratiae]